MNTAAATAAAIVTTLLESRDSVLANAMYQATQEFMTRPGETYVASGRPARGISSPLDVNSGYCEDWAECVRKLYAETTGEDRVEVLDASHVTGDPADSIEYGHVFIRLDRLYYDAEEQNGVTDWKMLPAVKRSN